ncbi:uncharacterized protein LOC143299444 isoform X2 [Babylonia areolata]|uniref:uncharacterized protein LOC143299444 isoform X2 n=1 Tax=Babylonia areolata TaxID=304850 RepID=UPI003FD11E3D
MAGGFVGVGIAATIVGCLMMVGFVAVPTAGQQTPDRSRELPFYKAHVLDQCCMIGMQLSNATGRCSGYPAPVPGVDEQSQSACLSIIEVCCLKQVQLDMCESGKRTALQRQMCAVRDSDAGAEQFRECCQCCQMGVAARSQSQSCEVPNLGEPCDSNFAECCTGRPSQGYTLPALRTTSAPPSNHTKRGEDKDEQEGNQNNGNDNNAGDGDDIDECTLFAGDVCSHLCVDLPVGFRCDCPPGFELQDDKRTCGFNDNDDEMDCSINNPCEQRCVNRNSGPECQCYEGYRLNDDRRTCADIDECAEGSYRCSPSQRCINTKGGYSCLAADCPSGTTRNPRTGQCEAENACLSGFAFNSHTRRCEDVNECALGYDNCKVGERCENTNGGFVCRRIHHCGTGYTLDEASQTCVDNDECALGTHNCAGGFICQNVQGSFRCVAKQCPLGFRFDSSAGECRRIICRRGMRANRAGSCVDIDECTEGTHRCLRHQRCINRVGSYLCRSLVSCPPGYEPTSNNGCQDINECTANKHRCSADQECVNRQGSYFCQCPRGMRHDSSGRCVDVNECAYGAAICPSSSRCVNTVGSFKCECKEGYISDENGGCLDIDECLADNMCQHKCRNVQGSYFCTCNRGYQLREDKRSCEDIDECTQFRGIGGRGGVCGGRCINTPGSYRCECPEGWRLKRDGRSCQDIDECQENVAFCPQQDGICINTRGSYKCPVVRCPEGFAKTTSTGPQYSTRCKRVETDCPECRRGLLSRSYNFLTFPSNVLVPAPLFSMTGARDQDKSYTWHLHLLSARPLRAGILPADLRYFQLSKSLDQAVVSLVTRVEGPQDIELRLDMNITSHDSGFEGVAESRIFLYITDDGSGGR